MSTVTSSQTSAGHTASGELHMQRRHKHKKHSDPFLEMSDDTVMLPDPTSAAAPRHNENVINQSESLLADLVLTPINMISFILSLVLVDRQQRQWRLSQHPSTGSFWSIRSRWSWLDPQPYQDSVNGTWQHSHSTAAQSVPDPSFQGWYTRKKHRAMAKMELSDAFEMRGRVMAAIITWTLLLLFAGWYILQTLYVWVFL